MENVSVKRERNYGIDLLRIICMIMIPVLHILGKGQILSTAAKGSLDYNMAWLLEVFCYGAVNCFGMISGYVGYGHKVKYANLAELWLRVFIYSALIAILYILFGKEQVTYTQMISSFFPTLSNSYWYFTAYFGLFLLMPFINKALESFNKTQLYSISAILFMFFSVMPTIGTAIFTLVLGEDYTNMVNSFSLNAGYSVIWLAALYFWGGVMKKYDLTKRYKQKVYVLFYVGCSLIAWGSLLILNACTDFTADYDNYIIGYLSPVILQGAVGLVCLCANANIKEKSILAKLIAFFAPLCFDVYLIHMQPLIKLHALTGKFLFLLELNPFFMVLAVIGFALVIFFVGCAIAKVRELIGKAFKVKQHLSNIETSLYNKLDKALAKDEKNSDN